MQLPNLSLAAWQSGLVALTVFLVLSGVPKLRAMQQFTTAQARLSTYRTGVLHLWVAALLALLLSPNELLTVPHTVGIDLLANSPVARVVGWGALVAYFGVAFGPGVHCALRPRARPRYGAALRELMFLLPVSRVERRWWVLLSITAGICEEIFFRSFLPQFAQGQSHGTWNLDPASAWLLSSLLFGGLHFYQGPAGIIRTALAGMMFSLLAILSGSILLPVVMHALVDLNVLYLYHPEIDSPDVAGRLIRGSSPMDDSERPQAEIHKQA